MRALLLSAGVGTRLRPFTDTWPKCLMPINNIPLLEYWIYDLVNIGVSKIYLNTHHCNEEVNFFIKNNKYKDQITIVHEKELLGTAGTIKTLNNELQSDRCIIVHADNFCVCSLSDYVQAHLNRPEKTEITMMTFDTKSPESCGIVETDENGIVISFTEKSSIVKGNTANAAIYIFEPSVIEWIGSQDKIYDISNDVIGKFISKINTWHNKNTLIDIGNINNLKIAQNAKHLLKKSEQSTHWSKHFQSKEIFKIINEY